MVAGEQVGGQGDGLPGAHGPHRMGNTPLPRPQNQAGTGLELI